jgi:hypothetical protein
MVFSVLGHEANTQMSFCPRTSKLESQNYQNWDFCNFGGLELCVQTFDWSEVQSKVVTLVKIFPMVCGIPLVHKEIKEIPNF